VLAAAAPARRAAKRGWVMCRPGWRVESRGAEGGGREGRAGEARNEEREEPRRGDRIEGE